VDQVLNKAGGFVWKVAPMDRLRRFLCLGCEGGTYYTDQRDLGLENATSIKELLDNGKGEDVVAELLRFSLEGRVAKQGPLLFSLAICARMGDEKTQQAAYAAFPKICRIPTHLFMFIAFCEDLSVGTGWGRAHRRAIQGWYNGKSAKDLAFTCTKYKNREGWTHTDVLRLCHAKPTSDAHNMLFKYITKGWDTVQQEAAFKEGHEESMAQLRGLLGSVEALKAATTVEEALAILNRTHLAREHIPTSLLNEPAIWSCMLEAGMPLTALLRNLAKMTAIGVLAPGSVATAQVCTKLTSEGELHRARVHPFAVLLALKTYEKGQGERGKLRWDPVPEIVQALDHAYHLAFANCKPTGKRFLLALDVSGSMGWGNVNGAPSITPRIGAAAMAMTTLRTEQECHVVAFTSGLTPLPLRAEHTLSEALSITDAMPFGGTDCAQPMLYALQRRLAVDVFVVYTDCETWAGSIHPKDALRQYRAATGIPAKLVVVGMTASNFTIADPWDKGMLDVAGFDANVPLLLESFARDEI
jgi:60 kDa SS-A/Ro ribonucleoprotein